MAFPLESAGEWLNCTINVTAAGTFDSSRAGPNGR
jgi:hypothetical protein